jgi:hypothetical protein
VVAGKRRSSRSVARNLPRLARSNRCRMGGIVATGTDCSDHRGVASATYRALAIRQCQIHTDASVLAGARNLLGFHPITRTSMTVGVHRRQKVFLNWQNGSGACAENHSSRLHRGSMTKTQAVSGWRSRVAGQAIRFGRSRLLDDLLEAAVRHYLTDSGSVRPPWRRFRPTELRPIHRWFFVEWNNGACPLLDKEASPVRASRG